MKCVAISGQGSMIEIDTGQTNRIFYVFNNVPGWMPINHMVDLACRLLNAQLCDLSTASLSRLTRMRTTLLAPPQGGVGGDIFILRNPAEMIKVLGHPAFQDKRAFRAIWIIDSFWTHNLVKPVRRLLSYFDVVGYTRQGDAEIYRHLCGDRAVFLGWGTDALDLGQDGGERRWDILRVGRQPPAWDDDTRSEEVFSTHGLRFHGRPPYNADPASQHRNLMQNWYAHTKLLIAHSNLAAPAPYTHPTKEYITARWTDALACGAVVAGVQPAQDLTLIDWPGAILHFDNTDLEHSLGPILEALQAWTPQVSANNRLEALRRLDWRWRISKLADHLGCSTENLKREIQRLDAEIARQEHNTA